MYQYCFTAILILLGLESLIVRGIQYHRRTNFSVTCLLDNLDLEVEDYQVFFSDVYLYGYAPPRPSRYAAFVAAVPDVPPPPQPFPPIPPQPIPLYSQFILRTVEGNAGWTHATTYRSFFFRLPIDGDDVLFHLLERSGSNCGDWAIPKVDCVIFTFALVDGHQIDFIIQKLRFVLVAIRGL